MLDHTPTGHAYDDILRASNILSHSLVKDGILQEDVGGLDCGVNGYPQGSGSFSPLLSVLHITANFLHIVFTVLF